MGVDEMRALLIDARDILSPTFVTPSPSLHTYNDEVQSSSLFSTPTPFNMLVSVISFTPKMDHGRSFFLPGSDDV